jgi:hypothetical protein
LCLGSSALGGHCKDACAADDEDTLVLDQLAVLNEECTSVDVKDLALSVLAAVLLDVVVVSDLRAIAVRGHGVSVPACYLRDLCVEKCAYIALLVHDLQDLTIDTDNTTNGGRAAGKLADGHQSYLGELTQSVQGRRGRSWSRRLRWLSRQHVSSPC